MPRSKRVAEPEELDDLELEDELEDLEEDEPEEKPARSRGKKARKTATAKKGKSSSNGSGDGFGSTELAQLLSERSGQEVTTRSLRILLRKLAKDGKIKRDVDEDGKTRYSFTGPNDPDVKTIIKAFEAGDLAAEKKEKLAELKNRKRNTRQEKKAKRGTSKSRSRR